MVIVIDTIDEHEGECSVKAMISLIAKLLTISDRLLIRFPSRADQSLIFKYIFCGLQMCDLTLVVDLQDFDAVDDMHEA
jgi:hypothetical protein